MGIIFKEVSPDKIEEFRIIYHQTTGYSNPIIETVLYQNKGGGIFYFGDMIDGNYMVFHRCGFAHINFNEFDHSINQNPEVFKEIDSFIKSNKQIPDYLMYYNTPEKLLDYWKTQDKQYFKIRKRIRYQIDSNKFSNFDKNLYAIPKDHKLLPLQECPYEDLMKFELQLESKFYDSKDQFLKNSFGFVLYNEKNEPTSISYLMCLIGRNSECDLKTFPEYRNKGYGFINITNYVKESLKRKINVGWDCFEANHTNEWVKQYGYSKIIREYDFVTYLK